MGRGLPYPFAAPNYGREDLTAMMGSCDNSIVTSRHVTSRHVTEHSARFFACQAVFRKNFKGIIAEDRDICALPSAFCAFIKGGDDAW